jgi:excisionase family DNA binding protein
MTNSLPPNKRVCPPLLSIAKLAERFDISTKTLRRRIAAGELRVIRIGRLIKVTEEEASLFLHRSRE